MTIENKDDKTSIQKASPSISKSDTVILDLTSPNEGNILQTVLLLTFGVYEPPSEIEREFAGCNYFDSPDSPPSSETESEEVTKKFCEKTRIEMVRLSRNPVDRSPIKDSEIICLSFGGCGFLGSYQFGAAVSLVDHGKMLLDRVRRYAGCSSGSLVAALMLFCPERIPEAVDGIYNVADEVNALVLGILTPGFSINKKLRSAIENYIPEDVSQANDRLFISVTRLKNWKNEIISTFRDREELIDVLMASCYHPMYSSGISGKAPILYDGHTYIDGGYTNILPEFLDMRTVSVTPFSGDADICPVDKSVLFNDAMLAILNQNMKVTFSNLKRFTMALVPPKSDELKKYFEIGKSDTERILKENEMFSD